MDVPFSLAANPSLTPLVDFLKLPLQPLTPPAVEEPATSLTQDEALAADLNLLNEQPHRVEQSTTSVKGRAFSAYEPHQLDHELAKIGVSRTELEEELKDGSTIPISVSSATSSSSSSSTAARVRASSEITSSLSAEAHTRASTSKPKMDLLTVVKAHKLRSTVKQVQEVRSALGRLSHTVQYKSS
jgi:hypothetical protein